MYTNIGKKVKGLAIGLCIAGALISFAYGLLLITRRSDLGFVIIIAGSLSSWLFSWVLYAIGEIAENISQIKNK